MLGYPAGTEESRAVVGLESPPKIRKKSLPDISKNAPDGKKSTSYTFAFLRLPPSQVRPKFCKSPPTHPAEILLKNKS